MSGMFVKKGKKMQTMTQYDLVPEVLYNSIEGKLLDKVRSILSPTHYRQLELSKEYQKLYL